MREYIATLLCVGCVCGIAQMLSPLGKGGGIKRQMRLVSSLCLLCVVASPIGNILDLIKNEDISWFDSFDIKESEEKYEESFIEYVEEYNADLVSGHIRDDICERFEIEVSDISARVSLSYVDNKCTIGSITVYIGKRAIDKNPHYIREYIKQRYGVECEIIYK